MRIDEVTWPVGHIKWPVCPFCNHTMTLEWYDDGTFPMWECWCDADVLEEAHRRYLDEVKKAMLSVSHNDRQEFITHLQDAAKKVSGWPRWKRTLLGCLQQP